MAYQAPWVWPKGLGLFCAVKVDRGGHSSILSHLKVAGGALWVMVAHKFFRDSKAFILDLGLRLWTSQYEDKLLYL